MVKYLVDTDVLIDYLKGKPPAVQLINRLGGLSQTAVSVVTMAEILEGAFDFPEKLEEARVLFETLEVFPVDKEIAKVFAANRKRLRDKHQLIDNMDLFVASTAIRHRLTLVTGNQKYFSRISDLKMFKPR